MAIMVTTTCPDKQSAENIAKALLTHKAAACVQIMPNMTSFYMWDGEIQQDSEYLLLIKTLSSCFSDVEKLILAHHPYDVPQIISFKCDDVHDPYGVWLKNNVNK